MDVWVSHGRSVHNERLVEQSPVAIGCVFQLVHEVGKQADMVFVDLRQLRHSLLIIAVVRRAMEAGCDAACRVGAPGGITAQFERRYVSDLAGKRQDLKVEHQFGMFIERLREAGRSRRQLPELSAGITLFDLLYSPLYLTDVFQILVQARTVSRAQSGLDPRRRVCDRIEKTAVLLAANGAILVCSPGAEHLIEHHPRISDHGKWPGG